MRCQLYRARLSSCIGAPAAESTAYLPSCLPAILPDSVLA